MSDSVDETRPPRTQDRATCSNCDNTTGHAVQLDDQVCFCFHISKRKILNYLRIHQPKRASQLTECGGAGSGCGWCVAYLKRNFEAFQAGQVDADADLSNEDHAAGRGEYIREGKGIPRPGTEPDS